MVSSTRNGDQIKGDLGSPIISECSVTVLNFLPANYNLTLATALSAAGLPRCYWFFYLLDPIHLKFLQKFVR